MKIFQKSSAKSKLSGQKTQSSRLAKGIWSSRRGVGRLGLSFTRQNAGFPDSFLLSNSKKHEKHSRYQQDSPAITRYQQFKLVSSNFCHSSCCPGSRGDGWGPRGEAFLRSKQTVTRSSFGSSSSSLKIFVWKMCVLDGMCSCNLLSFE